MTADYERVTEIIIPSSPDYLPQLRKVFSFIAASTGMDMQEIQDAKLAINEACANAIRHGSPQGAENSIQIRLRSHARAIVSEITDQGSGFDPQTLPVRDKEQPGGLGIPLMEALSDRVEFEKNGKGMTVRLTKHARSGYYRRRRRA